MRTFKTVIVLGALGIIVAAGLITQVSMKKKPQAPEQVHKPFERVISLSPSITEMLYRLELQDKLVGRTKFCDYPPEAEKKVSLGGYTDLNYEAVIKLAPDLVLVLPEHEKVKAYLSNLRIPYLEVKNKTLADILAAIEILGDVFHSSERAENLVKELKTDMAQIQSKTLGLQLPTVMIALGRNMGANRLTDVYIAGNKGFYQELLELAGARNAYTGPVSFPKISPEGMLHINPDIIIDIVPDLKARGFSKAEVLSEWESLPYMQAVAAGRVYVLGEDYVAIPGPRFIKILKSFVQIIHPEVNTF